MRPTCLCWGGLGTRLRDRFECLYSHLRAHGNVNASRKIAWIGETAPSPRAVVKTPDVGSMGKVGHLCVLP
ncbi:hypothetical protein MPNT_30001 [Candidatus Methylacidithermus pantelleriae]|uniref:Uncharacterized protein n=1 Tax=Candidatus Methylacidithermus pantelleriae TaxID=2744239 RepID=A0A8J2FWD9_9BACT|nr:hypothetical protein MPNT_30001 [Candidatus Methylacidithermus pantelleriae]